MNGEDNKETQKMAEQMHRMYKERETYSANDYPTDIPNDVCKYAFLKGAQFENSFMPRVHDFVPFMKCGDEELYLWTHTKNKNTVLVSRVSTAVKDKNIWKNVGIIIQLAYAYTGCFEHTMDIEYKWFYYFDPIRTLGEQEIYSCRGIDKLGLQYGTILKLTDFLVIARLIELLLRDDKAFTAMNTLNASMKAHYCCLLCELERYPYKKHPSHEPDLWERASVISGYETAIIQACRCVEALIGKPPKRDNRSRLLEHKKKWIDELGIDADGSFAKGEMTYIDFYYDLFARRNTAAHSFGTIPFELERRQAVNAQCFASLLLDGYVRENVLSEEKALEAVSVNRDIIDRVHETMSTSGTYDGEV